MSTTPAAILIGASVGGVEALLQLLPALPSGLPAAVLVVLHLRPDRASMLARIFEPACRLPAKEAEDKEPVRPGTIYFAPPDYHLLVDAGPHLVLSADDPVQHSRPSIDALFETAADVYGARALGIVLTGNSEDGAAGLAALARRGAATIVQDPADARGSVMPAAALERVPGAEVLSLHAIADRLRALPSDERP